MTAKPSHFLVSIDDREELVTSADVERALTSDLPGACFHQPVCVTPLDAPGYVPETFLDTRHVLYCGWICGLAIRNGLDVAVVHDEDGQATPQLQIHFPLDDRGTLTQRVVVVIPPPPADWSFHA